MSDLTVTKKVLVELKIRMFVDMPAEWDDDMVKFRCEDSFCFDNWFNDLAGEIEANQGTCQTCWRGDCKVLDYNPDPEDLRLLHIPDIPD